MQIKVTPQNIQIKCPFNHYETYKEDCAFCDIVRKNIYSCGYLDLTDITKVIFKELASLGETLDILRDNMVDDDLLRKQIRKSALSKNLLKKKATRKRK